MTQMHADSPYEQTCAVIGAAMDVRCVRFSTSGWLIVTKGLCVHLRMNHHE